MQALAERIEEWLLGSTFAGYVPLGFSGLKTAVPSPDELIGRTLTSVGRRAKYVLLHFDGEPERRVVFHLSQAGRVDFEQPPKKTKPKGSVVRWRFTDAGSPTRRPCCCASGAPSARRVGGCSGPATTARSRRSAPRRRATSSPSGCAPPPTGGACTPSCATSTRSRASAGATPTTRCTARKLSPYASLKSLTPEERERLLAAIVTVLADGLERERTRTGGLSANKLGEHFTVHGKAGLPCPVCGDDLKRVSYESHEVVYCPTCQTGGKVLADRRLSRLVK